VVAGDGDPVQDTASASGDDPLGGDASDTDGSSVDVLHPAIALATTATVATAHVGDTVTFLFAVTNPGDAPLSNVAVSGTKCDTGTMSAKTGDSNANNRLDTSETWTFHCTRLVQAADGTPLHNVGSVSAADAIGGPASASDSADVGITTATPAPTASALPSIEPSPEPSTDPSVEPTFEESPVPGASDAPTSGATGPSGTSPTSGGAGPTAAPGASPTGSDDGPVNLLILVLIVALATGAIGAYLNSRRLRPALAGGYTHDFDDGTAAGLDPEDLGEPPPYVPPERPVRVRRPRPPRSE